MTQEQDHLDPFNTVLLTTFVICKKRCKVYFHRGTLIWETERQPYTRWTLPLTDVLSACYGDEWLPGANQTQTETRSSAESPTSFVIHYAASGPKNKWSHHSVTMTHSNPAKITLWVETIRSYLRNLAHRPRKILLFINPFSGKRKGLRIWEKKVQPLLNIAGVCVKLIVTEKSGHIRDVLLGTDLEDVNAIACIGGDGTFSEVFNSLIIRTAKDHRVNPDDANVNLQSPKLPVGVIPSGSTDTVAYSLHGTRDVNTAVLHIIFGDTTGLDLSSVHENETLLRLYASVMSYGYLGDVIQDSEKFRWMGPKRYDYSGFKKIMLNKGYEGEVEILSDPCHPAESTKCTNNCSRCMHNKYNSITEIEISRWLTIRGKFFMVNGANIACVSEKSPNGVSPHCHIGDGCVDVILVRHTSLFNVIRMLLKLSSKEKNVYNLPFVEVYRAREFRFRAMPQMHLLPENEEVPSRLSSGVWNCDGEVIKSSNIKIRVHCQLLKVFTRRISEATRKRRFCCC